MNAPPAGGLDLGPQPRRRLPSLTPMIDVVFLLLVFFMLAARFGAEGALPLVAAAGGGEYAGPPRLVDVAPGGLRLNGVAMAEADLVAALGRLTEGPEDLVVLRPRDGARTEHVVAAIEALAGSGFPTLALVE